MAEPRTFKLRVGESGEWCQEGTLVKVEGVHDLEQLCESVGSRLGLIGVQVRVCSDLSGALGGSDLYGRAPTLSP